MFEKKNLLFKKVKCKGFYKSVQDGKRIEISSDGTNANYMVFDTMYEKKLCSCNGEKDFLKEFYEYKDKPFIGVVVSEKKKLKISTYIIAKKREDGEIETWLEDNEQRICAIVYYADNMKHYVPLEDIEEILE